MLYTNSVQFILHWTSIQGGSLCAAFSKTLSNKSKLSDFLKCYVVGSTDLIDFINVKLFVPALAVYASVNKVRKAL